MKDGNKGGKVNTEQFYELKLDIASVKTDLVGVKSDLEQKVSALSTNLTSLKENTATQMGSVKDAINSLKWYVGVPLAIISLLGIIGTSIAIYKNLSSNKENGLVGKAHASEQRIKDDSAESYIKSVIDKYAKEKNSGDVNLNYKLVFPGNKK